MYLVSWDEFQSSQAKQLLTAVPWILIKRKLPMRNEHDIFHVDALSHLNHHKTSFVCQKLKFCHCRWVKTRIKIRESSMLTYAGWMQSGDCVNKKYIGFMSTWMYVRRLQRTAPFFTRRYVRCPAPRWCADAEWQWCECYILSESD